VSKLNIRVTGGAGYIGTILIKPLIDDCHHIRCLDPRTNELPALLSLRAGQLRQVITVAGDVKRCIMRQRDAEVGPLCCPFSVGCWLSFLSTCSINCNQKRLPRSASKHRASECAWLWSYYLMTKVPFAFIRRSPATLMQHRSPRSLGQARNGISRNRYLDRQELYQTPLLPGKACCETDPTAYLSKTASALYQSHGDLFSMPQTKHVVCSRKKPL
jgi:hypothetical protein